MTSSRTPPDPGPGHPRRAARAALVLLAPVVAGCGSSGPAPALRFPGSVSHGAGISQGHVGVGGAATFGSIIVCGTRNGTRVESVTLIDAVGDIAVSSFAIRANPAAHGAQPMGADNEPLTALAPGVTATGPGQADACEGDAKGSEVLVQVTHTGQRDGCARGGFDLHYTSPSGPGTLHVPLALGVGQDEEVRCP